mmetsp:Transcript_51537/g.130274  ORF Transcript_51537/g.130274 Transcript_51537/m.130274 type:complete len:80 (+) Transcript_51537:1044-1283(+)
MLPPLPMSTQSVGADSFMGGRSRGFSVIATASTSSPLERGLTRIVQVRDRWVFQGQTHVVIDVPRWQCLPRVASSLANN